jgi:hypothetical protein
VEDGYGSVAVPFPELEVPAFAMRSTWTVSDLVGYLGTWSALRKAVAATRVDPMETVRPRLVAAWGLKPEREAVWPLTVRAFRVENPGWGATG